MYLKPRLQVAKLMTLGKETNKSWPCLSKIILNIVHNDLCMYL